MAKMQRPDADADKAAVLKTLGAAEPEPSRPGAPGVRAPEFHELALGLRRSLAAMRPAERRRFIAMRGR